MASRFGHPITSEIAIAMSGVISGAINMAPMTMAVESVTNPHRGDDRSEGHQGEKASDTSRLVRTVEENLVVQLFAGVGCLVSIGQPRERDIADRSIRIDIDVMTVHDAEDGNCRDNDPRHGKSHGGGRQRLSRKCEQYDARNC